MYTRFDKMLLKITVTLLHTDKKQTEIKIKECYLKTTETQKSYVQAALCEMRSLLSNFGFHQVEQLKMNMLCSILKYSAERNLIYLSL